MFKSKFFCSIKCTNKYSVLRRAGPLPPVVANGCKYSWEAWHSKYKLCHGCRQKLNQEEKKDVQVQAE